MRQLTIALGATAYAASATLAIFFAGLAIGSLAAGLRAPHIRRPLRAYAWLELGIALTALLYFGLGGLSDAVESGLRTASVDHGAAILAAKLAVTALLFLPSTICMGATLPMLAEHVVRDPSQLGRRGALLYAVNTVGGAVGAFAAGFYLPAAFGVRASYGLAIGLSLAVAAGAAWLSRAESSRRRNRPAPPERKSARAQREGDSASSTLLAFFSGAAALALEVLWTRMFAQVLHNSVYSFAAILVTFLVALALGAALARRLCRLQAPPSQVLVILLTTAGISVALTPWWFHFLTEGLSYVAPGAAWSGYVAAVFGRAAAALLVPGILIGTIFPYLLRIAESGHESPGSILGRLTAVNTLGAIGGAMAAGFLLLPLVGLWPAIHGIGLVYLAAAVWCTPSRVAPLQRIVPLVALLAFAVALPPGRLPSVRIDSTGGEVLLDSWESAYGITAVVRTKDSLRIKHDNYYSLGGTAAMAYEQTQGDVPLLLHPNPKSVFFLGLGTGITAGVAVRHDVDRIVVAELIPDVIEAARRHFGPYTQGLFDDPRVEIVAADGRQLLRTRAERFDVIIADLFIPWQAGAGSLYTREHFASVRDRLAPGGQFAQWLPLYQLSQEETMIIARTLLDVFPQVTVWRGDFLPRRPIVAFIASAEPTPLDPEALVRNFRHRRQDPDLPRPTALALTAMFYGGNLGAQRERFAPFPLNTDDRPIIEFSAPVTHRAQAAATARWFRGVDLARWYEQLAAEVPLATDPYLARFDASERGYAGAGTSLFASKAALAAGDAAAAEHHAEAFRASVPEEISGAFVAE